MREPRELKRKYICGIQQLGVGVHDLYKAWKWYIPNFGMNVRMFEEKAMAEYMLPYTDNKPRERHAALAINMQGGGGFEIWQHTQHKPTDPAFEIKLGDLGIFAGKIKSPNVKKAYEHLSKEATILTPLSKDPAGRDTFYVKDPFNNTWQIVEEQSMFMTKYRKPTGGTYGAVIGTTDPDKAREIYSGILGYDKVVYDMTGTFQDFRGNGIQGSGGAKGSKGTNGSNATNGSNVTNGSNETEDSKGTRGSDGVYDGVAGGEGKFRRVLLQHSRDIRGPFSRLFGPTEIELIQTLGRKPRKIYEDRMWGDPGFIHLCFDVLGMKALKEECAEKGFPFTVDSDVHPSGKPFDMGEAAGHFSYTEDPDGTLIEFVETHKIPISKKLGWYINLWKRGDVARPLSDRLLKLLRFMKVKPSSLDE